MQSDDPHLRTEQRDADLTIERIIFASGMSDCGGRATDNVSYKFGFIWILADIFPAELSAEGETNSTSGEFK